MIKAASLLSSLSRNAGGLFYSVRRLAQAVRARGAFDVEALGLGDAFSREDLPQWEPVKARVFPTLGPPSFGYSPGLRRALLESPCELLHCHGIWMYPSFAALQWWRRRRRPYLVSPHGMMDPWAMGTASLKKAAASALFQREHLLHAACFHSLCASETASIRALGLKQPVCQIPNGVDLPVDGAAGPAPWAARLKEGERVLFSLGRLHPKKGLPALLEAFSRVRKSSLQGARSWRLAVAGWDQGGHEQVLKAQARALGVEEEVIFTGPLFGAAKADAFRAASAFVLPSHSEGLPVAVLEAWSYGLPVLMTPECNLPEGFEAKAAVKVSASADALEGSLAAFFREDPSAHRAMGERGRALVAERFTWERIGEQMNAVNLWLVQGGPAPSCVVL